jgi:hypothetical protein
MVFMGEPVSKENYNDVLLPRQLIPGPLVKRIDSGTEGAGFNFDFKPTGVHHPFLRLFENEENTGLGTAKSFIYWQADVPADSSVERVLNYLPAYDKSGNIPPLPPGTLPDPAITVHSVGQGRVVFFATSASPGREPNLWTNFPAKMAYVELMNEILSGGVRAGDYWMNLTVGQALEVPAEVKLTGAPELHDDANVSVLIDPVAEKDPITGLDRTDRPLVYRSRPLSKPGIYTLNLGTGTVPIAVNVPARDEADIRTLGNEEVRKSLGDIQMTLAGDEIPSEASLASNGNDWGGPILLAVLAMLAVEGFMAMSFGHYRRSARGSNALAPSSRSPGPSATTVGERELQPGAVS